MAIVISGTTNDITINGVSVATDAEVSSAVAPLATTTYVDGKMVLSTAVTASGTAIDFTGIPSWVKRITVMFNGVSTNGASAILIQLGTSSSIESTGYASAGFGANGTAVGNMAFTTGFATTDSTAPSYATNGSAIINGLGSNDFTMQGVFQRLNGGISMGAGSKTLSGTLNRVRITTLNGTDTFDAGQINIIYEG